MCRVTHWTPRQDDPVIVNVDPANLLHSSNPIGRQVQRHLLQRRLRPPPALQPDVIGRVPASFRRRFALLVGGAADGGGWHHAGQDRARTTQGHCRDPDGKAETSRPFFAGRLVSFARKEGSRCKTSQVGEWVLPLKSNRWKKVNY